MDKMPKKGAPCPINYGFCEKKKISVTFIPNTCNPENLECFKHRKEILVR
jgi:hypothetical protein